MSDLNILLEDIEKLRKDLMDLIDKKQMSLQDPEIVYASQILDAAITKYNEFIKKML